MLSMTTILFLLLLSFSVCVSFKFHLSSPSRSLSFSKNPTYMTNNNNDKDDDIDSNIFRTSSSKIENEVVEDYFDYSKGYVVKKKKNGDWKVRDSRDTLPFQILTKADVNEKEGNTNNDKFIFPTELGTYMLDSSTNCGDIVDLGSRGRYVVRSVSFLYKYEFGSFNVFKKKLEVTLAKPPFWDESLLSSSSVLQ